MLEWLKEILGDAYSEEADKRIADEIGKGFVARQDFNTVNESKKALEEQLKERDRDLARLSKDADGNQALQQQYADLQAKYKESTAGMEKKLAELRLDHALDLSLMQAKARNLKAVKALLDMEQISLKEDGTVDGLEPQLEALKQTDGYQFEMEETRTEGPGYEPSQSTTALESFRTQFENALQGK